MLNKRRQRLKCSHYLPVVEGQGRGSAGRVPCVIYCHGNCGSRVDASDCLDLLLPQNISVRISFLKHRNLKTKKFQHHMIFVLRSLLSIFRVQVSLMVRAVKLIYFRERTESIVGIPHTYFCNLRISVFLKLMRKFIFQGRLFHLATTNRMILWR